MRGKTWVGHGGLVTLYGKLYDIASIDVGFKIAMEATPGVPHYLQLAIPEAYELQSGFMTSRNLIYSLAAHYPGQDKGQLAAINIWTLKSCDTLIVDLLHSDSSYHVSFKRTKKNGQRWVVVKKEFQQQWEFVDEHQKYRPDNSILVDMLKWMYQQYVNELVVPSSTVSL